MADNTSFTKFFMSLRNKHFLILVAFSSGLSGVIYGILSRMFSFFLSKFKIKIIKIKT
jgi:hypothetical protein